VQEGIYYNLPFLVPVGLYAVLAAVAYRNRRTEAVGADEKEAQS
jgi:hypothetical protein